MTGRNFVTRMRRGIEGVEGARGKKKKKERIWSNRPPMKTSQTRSPVIYDISSERNTGPLLSEWLLSSS